MEKTGARVSVWLSILVVSLFASSIRCDDVESKEFVLTLDHSNFTETVSKQNFIVVEFYAPWCGHCKNLAPQYEKAASVLSSLNPPLLLAKIDASDESNKDIAKKFDIQGFPTIKILRDGGKSVTEYNGPREADGIVAYVKKQSGPASVEIKSSEAGASLIGDKNIIVVGVFPKFSGEEYENFMAFAEKMRSDYDFGHTSDAKFLPRGDSSVTGPVVRLFKPFDELFVDFKDFKSDAMEKFVKESTVPLVTIFDSDKSNFPYVEKFFGSSGGKAMLFINFTEEKVDAFKSKFREIAQSHKGEGLNFLIGDPDNSQGAYEFYGLQKSQLPLILIQTQDQKKYLKPNVELDQISSWMKDFKDGKVPQFIKSQPIPSENNEPVKVVVADSLQDMVLNSGKNILLEFYAPWCGHCQKLAPILDEVAVSYESDPDVVIAKLDATANDFPTDQFDVNGFPTMYFRSASGKIQLYEGERTKEDIISFIDKNRDGKTAIGAAEKAATKEAAPSEPAKDEL